MSFLNAEWRNLILANYELDKNILKKYIPNKTELDLWKNTCYVSLVGFMFLNTKVLGIKIPFHINFEEVNLRFYVKYKDGNEWKRGVVFIKELVPKHAITLVANIIYKEHYQTMKMKHKWAKNDKERKIEYHWRLKNKWNKFSVNAELNSSKIEEGSEAEFITEHYWGYSRISPIKTFEYEVTHPRWEQYKVIDHSIDVDFNTIYGRDFGILNNLEPQSIMLAKGSEITVEKRRRI